MQNPGDADQKDVLLLVTSKFNPGDGLIVGGVLPQENVNAYCLMQSSERKKPLTISSLPDVNLHSSCMQNISSGDSLPVNCKSTLPLITCLSYDDNIFRQSEGVGSHDGSNNICFDFLHSKIGGVNYNDNTTTPSSNLYKLFPSVLNNNFNWYFRKIHDFFKKSYWYTHFSANVVKIVDHYASHHGKTTIRRRNMYLAKVFDFVLGLFTLYLVLEHKTMIWNTILQTTKYIIDALKQVLDILMGAPAGLKLNCALNKTLGTFFFYHISLWKAFVESIFAVPASILYAFVALGSLGLSYQITLCADVIMFLTFHVYCIYVYAARLFRVQIYTITSLWRLFIGRKYNPLKNRVDSFQYSHNQLFVGTLGFTILLFLLPTTFLYYIVFTAFRIVVQIVCKLMFSIATSLSSTPLYLFFLRLTGSSRIKGSVYIYAVKNVAKSRLQLHVSLDLLDCWFHDEQLPATRSDKPGRTLHDYVNSLCTGKLL